MSPEANAAAAAPARLGVDLTAPGAVPDTTPAQTVRQAAARAGQAGLGAVLAPSGWLPPDTGEDDSAAPVIATCGFPYGRQHDLVAASEARLAVQFGAVGVLLGLDPAVVAHGGENAVLTRLVTAREAVSEQVWLGVLLPAATAGSGLEYLVRTAARAGVDAVVLDARESAEDLDRRVFECRAGLGGTATRVDALLGDAEAAAGALEAGAGRVFLTDPYPLLADAAR